MNRELTFPHLSGRLKRFFSAHSFLFLLYFPLFFVLFELSESGRFIQSYHTIEIIFDRYIPFCSVFVVPYIAWFVFVGGMAAYTYFFEKREFLHYMSFVAITYSVGLITFFAFPSIQHRRVPVASCGRAVCRALCFMALQKTANSRMARLFHGLKRACLRFHRVYQTAFLVRRACRPLPLPDRLSVHL